MLQNPQRSVETLWEEISELEKKYRISEYEIEAKSCAVVCGAPASLIESNLWKPEYLISNDSPGVFDDYNKRLGVIQERYSYLEFYDQVTKIKGAFLSDRKDYLYRTFLKRISPVSLYMSEDRRMNVFLEWLDKTIEVESPMPITISYEDFDGQVKSVRAVFQDVVLDEDYVECQPIDYFYGFSRYDSLLVHHVYDLDTKKWTPIPVELIRCYYVESNDGKQVLGE